MNIQDLEYFCAGDEAETIQGGVSPVPGESGIVISSEGGELTLLEDGVKLFSYRPEEQLRTFSFRIKGASGVSKRCQSTGSGNAVTSICQVSFNPTAAISRFRSRFFFSL